MVNISVETPEQVEERITNVLKVSRLKIYENSYTFEESPLAAFPQAIDKDALALIRDDKVWSQLVPCNDPSRELFSIFRFHFPKGADNSGFVGWLAMHLKDNFGTGVFVTCGQNSSDGGIFDYWGCPLEMGPQINKEVQHLTGQKG